MVNTNAQQTFGASNGVSASIDRSVIHESIDYRAHPGPLWGEKPYKDDIRTLAYMRDASTLPQDCSMIAMYLMRHGFCDTVRARICYYRKPFRQEIWIDDRRFAAVGTRIYEL